MKKKHVKPHSLLLGLLTISTGGRGTADGRLRLLSPSRDEFRGGRQLLLRAVLRLDWYRVSRSCVTPL